MKSRSDVVQSFETFFDTVSSNQKKNIQSIRTDNALEYVSEQFKSMLKKKKVVHQLAVPNCPQQN